MVYSVCVLPWTLAYKEAESVLRCTIAVCGSNVGL